MKTPNEVSGNSGAVQSTVTATPTPSATANAANPDDKPSKTTRASQGSQVGGPGDDVGDTKNTFTMPDETGKNLQAAQDDLQAISGNPVFYSGSQDATDQDRGQWWDRDWKVCSQDPAPGAAVEE